MLYIDQFVYSNKMRAFHPIERFAFAMLTLTIGLIADKPLLHLVILIIMPLFLILKAKIATRVIIKLFSLPLGFLVIGVATIAMNVGLTDINMLFSVKIGNYYLGVTESSLTLALQIVLKSLSSVACLYFLVLTTPMIELIHIFQLLKFPAIITELMMLMYRFIFIFIETAFNIYTSQSSRWGYCSFKRSINSIGLLFVNLWGKAFLKSQSLFTSLVSRGYEGELKVLNPRYKISKTNILIFSLVDITLIVMALV